MASSTVDAVIAAPRDAVYKFFTERDGINPYIPVDFTLKTPGTPTPNGVGAQYLIGKGGVGIVEETTKLVPGELMEYKIIKGAPVKRHVGTITFTDVDNGTLVSYTMESEPSLPVPAKVLEFGLKNLINQFIKGAQKALR
ncbi:SRPBCC family protein [Nocardia sp. NBC_00565]|uniref:SRPBCC family protein n=1 Tax=Nocardia sp. NBC_00565 TaxID=2975993 RepID=UPI002E81107C|nr:SRPBCC family protein [Nocardia sp. NBC_00565]WUC04660.1 SRPBCC family protein [Nocardia sp. NBC_00565]